MPIADTTVAGVTSMVETLADIKADRVSTFVHNTWADITASGVANIVYQRNNTLWPGQPSQVYTGHGGSGTHFDFGVRLATENAENQNSYIRYLPIDISGYRTLQIFCNLQTEQVQDTYAGVVIHNDFGPEHWEYPMYFISGDPPYNISTAMMRVRWGETFNGVWEVDVSALSGVYYVMTMCYNQHWWPATSVAEISKIIAKK